MDRGRVGYPHHELTCFVCACKVERPAEERPIEILPDPKSAGTYEPASQPVVKARIADCVAMEERFRAGKMNDKDREEMIRHTMYGFARIYDEIVTERVRPWDKVMVVLVIVGVGFGGVYAWHRSGHWWPMIVATVAVLLIFWASVYWVTRHSPRRRVRLWLAKALLPLDPTSEEIRRARAEMQASRVNAGFRIRSSKVLAKIEELKAKGS